MLWWLAETTLVATALAVVASLAPRVRNLSPAVRHVLWLVVLVKLVTPPLVRWPWPVVPPTPARLGAVSEDVANLDPGTIEIEESSPTAATAPPAPEAPWAEWTRAVDPAALSQGLMIGWIAISGGLTVWQIARIVRFRRNLRDAAPAPEWLVGEAGRVAERIGVRAPEMLVAPFLAVPMLWCLGRSKLLLPAHLVETLGAERWRGILAHELAHLRRGDPWVRRLELAAGLFWWWNPLYLLTRRKIDAEAEFACDAWVVSTLPGDRLVYAETMVEICALLTTSAARPPAPVLGVTGAGRSLERRLTMILGDHVPCHLSFPGLIGAGLLVLLASPSWSAGEAPAPDPDTASVSAAAAATSFAGEAPAADDDDPEDVAKAKAEAERAAAAAERAAREAERALRQANQAAERAAQRAQNLAKRAADRAAAKAADADKAETAKRGDLDVRRRERRSELAGEQREEAIRSQKEAAEKLGPDFEKKMEELGKKIEKEFGPEFEKKMEVMGKKIEKEMTAKFGPGSEFEKQMKGLGDQLAEKFGPGSEFEGKVKEFGEKFGPVFEDKIKDLAEHLKSQLGPGSDFEKAMKDRAAKPGADYAPKPRTSVKLPLNEQTRIERIQELESKLDQIMAELKELKSGLPGSTPSRNRR